MKNLDKIITKHGKYCLHESDMNGQYRTKLTGLTMKYSQIHEGYIIKSFEFSSCRGDLTRSSGFMFYRGRAIHKYGDFYRLKTPVDVIIDINRTESECIVSIKCKYFTAFRRTVINQDETVTIDKDTFDNRHAINDALMDNEMYLSRKNTPFHRRGKTDFLREKIGEAIKNMDNYKLFKLYKEL